MLADIGHLARSSLRYKLLLLAVLPVLIVTPLTLGLAVYWYRFGGRRTTSFLEQQVRLSLRLPFGNDSADGSLVRLSTRIDPNEEGAEARALIRVVELAARIAEHESNVEKTSHPDGE